MVRKNYLFTSESVSEGHPDKVCDRISDEVVDAFYRAVPPRVSIPGPIRAACETLATTNRVVIAGEYRGPKSVDEGVIADVTRQAIRDIGYEQDGFTGKAPRSRCCCTPNRRISRRAWTPSSRRTRKRAPATRASCSAMPAGRRRS